MHDPLGITSTFWSATVLAGNLNKVNYMIEKVCVSLTQMITPREEVLAS